MSGVMKGIVEAISVHFPKSQYPPPLMSVDVTRRFCGNRGRGWVYERINSGDFETIRDGGRRFVLTASVLDYIERLRAAASGD